MVTNSRRVATPDYHLLNEQCDDCGIRLVVAEANHSGNPYDFPVVACFGCMETVRKADGSDLSHIHR